MIARRRLLAAAAWVAAGPAAFAAPAELHFEVFRNDKRIGQHVVTFQRDGAGLVAIVAVEIAVKIGPIALFRYTHSVREIWRDGQFVQLDSETNDDGKPFKVHAIRTGDHVVVETPHGPRQVLGSDAIPLTHWNVLCMRRPLFNPQDGAIVASAVIPRGAEMVALADGRQVRAAHYSLTGKVALEDWYDDAGQWAALDSIGTDG